MTEIYLVKATKEQLTLITEIMEALEISDFKVNQLQLGAQPKQTTNIVLCFGDPAYNIVSNVCPTAVKLPAIDKLIKKPGNENFRESTWAILKSIYIDKTINPQTFTLTSKDIKEFDLEKLSKNNWIGITEDNKKILISNTNQTDSQYHLTFEELILAKTAFDILGLKSLTIGKNNEKE